MKSIESGRSIWRARSLTNMKAPFSTPTRTSSLPRWSRSISAASSRTRPAICCCVYRTSTSSPSFIGSPRDSHVRVVHQLAESAAARHDVLPIVQPALPLPQGAWNGVEDLGRREPPVEAQRIDHGPGVLGGDPLHVLGSDDQVRRNHL